MVAVALSLACSDNPSPVDSPPATSDASAVDSGVELDGSVGDSDAGSTTDAGSSDASDGDGGNGDVGSTDQGSDTGFAPDAEPSTNNPVNRRIDFDCDGLSDQAEFANRYPGNLQTLVDNPDTDGDGLPDGLEVAVTAAVAETECVVQPDLDPLTRTSPVDNDTDNDGILDGIEDANRNGRVDPGETDPLDADSDDDQIPDGVEDANRNGVVDVGETDPASFDTDMDGLSDGIEDLNRDGIKDLNELDPRLVDTDADQLSDAMEDVNANGVREDFETDGNNPDTDCDGLSDGAEILANPQTSPLSPDTDRDGLIDSLEASATSTVVAGSNCPPITLDVDLTTSTNGSEADTDQDGLPDGVEDANQNGRVDPGETDPNVADSDMDGLDDGTEVLAGTDPLDGDNPSSTVGIFDICASQNLVPLSFHQVPQLWTFATTSSVSYQTITVAAGLQNTLTVASLDDTTHEVSGFVIAMPLLSGDSTPENQEQQLTSQILSGISAEGINQFSNRGSPIFGTSHDGFPAGTNALVDIETSASISPAELRNRMVRLVTDQPAASFSGLTTPAAANATEFIYGFQLLIRDNRLFVIGALVSKVGFEADGQSQFTLRDITNGSSFARDGAEVGRACDLLTITENPKADFIWMADVSGSTNLDRAVITQAATAVFEALDNNNVDFRMAVVRHTANRFSSPGNAGQLVNPGFTTNQNTFTNVLGGGSGGGCELGLTAADDAIARALPRTAPGSDAADKIREGAQLVVVYVSDEFAEEVTEEACGGYTPSCMSGIEDFYNSNGPADDNNAACMPTIDQTCFQSLIAPYIQNLQDNNALAFAQVVEPQTPAANCTAYGCNGDSANEPGLGYVEVVNALGGSYYSPCNASPGGALDEIVNRVTVSSSQFVLSKPPVSSTIKIGLVRDGMVIEVPRSTTDGFDYGYTPSTDEHKIFFSGTTYRLSAEEQYVVSYRAWDELPSCPEGQIFDVNLGICVCDLSVCNQNCSANEVCDATCGCSCSANCNGNCGAGEVCNQATCQCECAADCGGCPDGTMCNQNTCQCECDDCGGACEGNNTTCDTDACFCECDNCGGSCDSNQVCNDSSCTCGCSADCDENCPGFGSCNVDDNCACECTNNCNDTCFGTATCDTTACDCACPMDCSCPGNQVCNPANGCACECPSDCGGGCSASETCNQANCQCEPRN